jgi:hypothetical protein
MLTLGNTVIGNPEVVVILLLLILTCPAISVLVTASAPPLEILDVRYAIIARWVGIILLELAAKF